VYRDKIKHLLQSRHGGGGFSAASVVIAGAVRKYPGIAGCGPRGEQGGIASSLHDFKVYEEEKR